MRQFFKRISGLGDKSGGPVAGEARMENVDEQDVDYLEDAIAEDEVEEAEQDPEEREDEEKWLGEDFEEGQLSIDVYQTPEKLVVKSTIAGVKPEDIDISINNDMLTIRGRREMTDQIREDQYLFRECYWGSFSRSIILPVEIEPEKIEAVLENGVLTVILPKAKNAQQISIKVRER